MNPTKRQCVERWSGVMLKIEDSPKGCKVYRKYEPPDMEPFWKVLCFPEARQALICLMSKLGTNRMII